MLYYTWNVKENEYKLRLNAKNTVDLEKYLGANPVTILTNMSKNNELPDLDTLLTIISYSMQQFNHGISLNDVYNIYDEYIDDGHNMFELLTVVMEIYKVSGLIPEVDEKN